MDVLQIFYIEQMVPNRAQHHIFDQNREDGFWRRFSAKVHQGTLGKHVLRGILENY